MTGHSSKSNFEKYKHHWMSNEEHNHLEMENSQYQNESHLVYQKF